jgi:hypothetical protein
MRNQKQSIIEMRDWKLVFRPVGISDGVGFRIRQFCKSWNQVPMVRRSFVVAGPWTLCSKTQGCNGSKAVLCEGIKDYGSAAFKVVK